jgi:hypothetical protein
MTVKELIQAEIDKIPETELNEVYQLIKEYNHKKDSSKKGVLSKIKQIKIQAPKDFSINFDYYSSQDNSHE